MIRLFSIVTLRMLMAALAGGGVVLTLAVWLMLRSSGPPGPGDGWIVVLAGPAPVLFAMVFVLVLMQPQRYLRDIDAMLAGGAWAYWRYDERDWQAANEVADRHERRNWYVAAAAGVVLGLVVLGCALVANSSVYTFAGAVAAGLSLVALAVIELGRPSRAARRSSQGEMFVSPLGIYRRPGGYMPLYGFGMRLCGVELVEQPPVRVRFNTVVQTQTGPTRERWADVAVPAGREDEARRLVERFRSEVLGAA